MLAGLAVAVECGVEAGKLGPVGQTPQSATCLVTFLLETRHQVGQPFPLAQQGRLLLGQLGSMRDLCCGETSTQLAPPIRDALWSVVVQGCLGA